MHYLIIQNILGKIHWFYDALPFKNNWGYPIHVVGDFSYLQDIKRLYMKKYSVVVCKFLLKYTPYLVGMLMAILCAGCTALFSSSSSLPLTCGNRKTASDSMITTVKLHAHGLKTQLQILINHMHTQSVHVCSIAIVDFNIYGLILVSSLSTCELHSHPSWIWNWKELSIINRNACTDIISVFALLIDSVIYAFL